jgi:Fur family ferric uptake transcriptional regulator
MDVKEKFLKYIAEKGLRHTEQRLKVLEVLWHTEKHVSAQELFDLVRQKHKGIGYATVARTLKLLDEAGICRPVDLGDGLQRFEHKWGHEHHDHLICTRCGRFVEILSPELEKLQEKLVETHGYTQEYHKLDIFGICPVCQENANSKERSAKDGDNRQGKHTE